MRGDIVNEVEIIRGEVREAIDHLTRDAKGKAQKGAKEAAKWLTEAEPHLRAALMALEGE